MALEEINKDAISFKRLSGKAHTQFGFGVSEEKISSNIQIAFTTVFGETPDKLPATNVGSSLGDTDGVVEKIRFEIDIIPEYSGVLSSTYGAGTYLYEALGKLQIVPSLYGELQGDGTTEYDPVLYDTNLTEITKFDPINWNLDTYSGVLFVEDPPLAFDTQPERPAFIDAYLFVGKYLDVTLEGVQSFNAGQGINSSDLSANTLTVDLANYDAPNGISISYSGSSGFIIEDNSVNKFGVRYAANYAPFYTNRSLVDKQYVDSVASGLSPKDAVQVATTSNIALAGINNIDGVPLQNGHRVLVKNQNDKSENGIYKWTGTTSGLTRTTDFDENSEVVSGAFTSVISGNTNAATLWVVSTPNPINVGTTNIEWIALALPIVYVGGIGIDVNGTTIDLDGASLAGLGINWNVGDSAFDIAFSATSVGSGVSIFKDINTIGNNEVIRLRSLVGSGGTTITQSGDVIIIQSDSGTTSGVIGTPMDGTYLDGLFAFTSGTTIANAIDPINEFLAALAPAFAPNLDNINVGDTFVSGNLSFGTTRNDISYTNVGTAAGNSAVDINELYTISGTRKGIINIDVTDGTLNEDVVGNSEGVGIPYLDDAFNYGDEGDIVLEVNGAILSTLDLTSGSSALANTNIAVSAVDFSKFSSGSDFAQAPYRTGSFSIFTGDMVNGFNYARVIHSGTTEGNIITNYIEWVYDLNGNNISGGTPTIDNVSLTGSKFLSGIEYFEGGSVDYNIEVANVYRNVYSDSSNAIQFTNRENLSDVTVLGMDITGTSIVNSLGQLTKDLPILDTAVVNPESKNINIDATLQINSNIIIGNAGSTGRVRSSISINHPFSSKSFAGAQATETDFLLYNIADSSTEQDENFTGESNRLEARTYIGATYANVNGGTFNWNSELSLVGANAQHNTGMLTLNGGLYYPSSSLITTEYGITSGNFSSVTNSPVGNPNYSSASGERDYYRKFKSNNSTTQSTLSFEITHTGNLASFLTNGGTGGTPTGNQIKLEFLIIRIDDTIHGWANPFASSSNPEGITVTSTSHSGGITTVNCTLSTTPRVGDNDLVLVRMKFASGYAQKVTNLKITNIE